MTYERLCRIQGCERIIPEPTGPDICGPCTEIAGRELVEELWEAQLALGRALPHRKVAANRRYDRAWAAVREALKAAESGEVRSAPDRAAEPDPSHGVRLRAVGEGDAA